MMDERKMNNSTWVIEELTEWLDRSIREVNKLAITSTKTENARLYEKECTLRMVRTKLEQLKYE